MADLIIDKKYYNALDIEGFSKMMNSPSYCYKFYWLEAIVQLISENKTEATQITKLSNTQNRIEGKDFASLDPEQERLRMELSLGGIQYLYKDGSQIEDPEHQILLDETIVSQACLLDEISIIALVKGNVGALTENIDKVPYERKRKLF